MKTLGIVILALTWLTAGGASPAVSKAPHFRIYFDKDFTVDAKDCPGLGVFDTLYVVAEDFDAWILAIEYEIDYPSDLFIISDIYSFEIVITHPSNNGVAVGFSPLNGGEPLLIQRVAIMYVCDGSCPVQNIPIQVVPNSGTGHLRAVRWPDMAYVDAVIDGTLGKHTYLCPSATGVDGSDATPATYSLRQCVPNPFNPTTTIEYGIPDGGGRVTIGVFDVGGRLVRTLVDGWQAAGWKSTTWNATDAANGRVASGVYFYRMTAPGFTLTRKMVLLK